jgi:hypothetical protein
MYSLVRLHDVVFAQGQLYLIRGMEKTVLFKALTSIQPSALRHILEHSELKYAFTFKIPDFRWFFSWEETSTFSYENSLISYSEIPNDKN